MDITLAITAVAAIKDIELFFLPVIITNKVNLVGILSDKCSDFMNTKTNITNRKMLKTLMAKGYSLQIQQMAE